MKISIIIQYVIVFSIILLSFLVIAKTIPTSNIHTGFWYHDTRPPDMRYDTVPYANLTVKVNKPFTSGPGQDLVTDPFNYNISLYVGPTINRQSFDSQFILDLNYATGINTNRVYVISVSPGKIHFSWESNYVIVNFIFLERSNINDPTLLEAIATLTNQIQKTTSKIYIGTNVTNSIDPLWGVQVLTWDTSLKLTYPINIIGDNAVQEGYYLNQGSLGICDEDDAYTVDKYCEFERFFEDDVSRALNISYYRVQVLLIKTSSLDSVLVHFRLTPQDIQQQQQQQQNSEDTTNNIFTIDRIEQNITYLIGQLALQVADYNSELYKGNVTIRTDPTWGVDGFYKTTRKEAAKFTLKYYDQSDARLTNPIRLGMITSYDRCKANRRCNWGIVKLDQYTNDATFYQRLFDRGTLYQTNLFLDFEDWRMGSRGFSLTGDIPPTANGFTSLTKARASDGIILGTHFSPFNQKSLGTDIPCYEKERNQGLVLDRILQRQQINQQEAFINDIHGKINWIENNIEDANMTPDLRSRKNVRENLTWVQADLLQWLENENYELKMLNSSQCVMKDCFILFNTSSLELTGAVNDTGVVKLTANNTEVALFTFNSIYLGPEVKVYVVGQRALALISKTSMIINTTIEGIPGTLGGFQGGGSVARYFNDALSDKPRSIFICDIGNDNYCSYLKNNTNTDASLEERMNITSNNVNGPGSGNLRVNAFVIETSATYVQEVQVVKTTAAKGQTLSGGFTLHFKGYSTTIIPYDATTYLMKKIIESNLNIVNPEKANIYANRNLSTIGSSIAGIGIVNITRPFTDDQEGYTWKITYTTAIGNIPLITAKSYLKSNGANIITYTERDGNEIDGTFQLEFQGALTQPIPAAVSANQLTSILIQLPMISTAYVTRNDPTNNCDDGLCPNGPFTSRGLLWTVYITTNINYDNITPTSPTSLLLIKQQGIQYDIIPHYNNLLGINSKVIIYKGTSKSLESPLNLLDVSIPFSFAWGGGGGSYGGVGGIGYGLNPIGSIYNDIILTDLLGGSGGSMRSLDLYEINSFLGPTSGRGGHGGGAIELIASNDITIGTYGKIIMKGGNGEQTSEGGGGGGSGGAILLSSGTTILIDGVLDVSGGDGGFGGFLHYDLAGGGGGGGRIAIFAESIALHNQPQINGGKCGIYYSNVTHKSIRIDLSLYMIMISPLDNNRLSYLGFEYLKLILQPNLLFLNEIYQQDGNDICLIEGDNNYNQNLNYNNNNNDSSTSSSSIECYKYVSTKHALMNTTIVFYNDNNQITTSNIKKFIQQLEFKLNSKINMNIAEVIMKQGSIDSYIATNTINYESSSPTSCQNNGNFGTLYTQAKMTTAMYISPTIAAENTSRALFLSNRENTNTSTGSFREAPFSGNGPIVPFEASRPVRITYYTRTDAIPYESLKSDYGSLFTLITRGEEGLNVSNVIGVFFGSKIMHGSNFGSTVDEAVFLKRLVSIDNYPILSRWYKIDIKIQWLNKTYSVSIDDSVLITSQKFIGDDIDGIRLSTYRAIDVWFDEIYVGFDNSLDFQCPISFRTGTTTQGPIQRHWSYEEVHGPGTEGYTAYNQMTRHYNFLNTEGYVAYDGQGHVSDNQDIKLQYLDGDYPLTQGLVHAGALVYLTNSLRSGKTPLEQSKTLVSKVGLWSGVKDGIGGAGDGRQFWYTEYNYISDLSSSLNGGVAACSSQDLVTWRFEGIVFHYVNLSDLVYGRNGPFYVERPKVLFNSKTKQYVMWSVMDNDARQLALCAIATSPYEDGPFLFRRSFYPDGNQTRDQVIYITTVEKIPLLARTYYQTVEFLLPQAVMQPIWESAKSRSGSINYRSNYHRSFYDEGYDNFNDIYLQRWRTEDQIYNVICINKLTNEIRKVDAGVYKDGGACLDPEERKVVLGQGDPIVTTKFVSPNDSDNSWWRPTSVPNVKAQAWSNNYRDGYCGIRKLNDDYDIKNPNLATFIPEVRNTCSNIADNPIHDTYQDKLIGVTKIVATRRAKFIAISQLTDDFLDTNGWLNSFEGELESGDMISLIVEMGQFGFTAGDVIQSTFRRPIRSEFETAIDYQTRYHQYINNVNDRASYSLACVLDGICPVNFRDQLNL